MDLPSKRQEHEKNPNAGNRKSAKSEGQRCETVKNNVGYQLDLVPWLCKQ